MNNPSYKSKYTGEEIEVILEEARAMPLYVPFVINLKWAQYDTIYTSNPYDGGTYANSLPPSYFSRTPKADEIFWFIFIDGKKNVVFSLARITNPLNSSGFSEWRIVEGEAVRLHNAQEIAELKEAVLGLKTEEWTFIVEVQNEDGTVTTKPVPKKVVVK